MGRHLWIPLLLITAAACAQQNFASLSFGTSLPLAAYADEGDLSATGYAYPGAAIKFDAGYFPVSYLGIGGSFSFGSNLANRDSMLGDMIRHVESHASEPLAIPEEEAIMYGSDFWNYISLFTGPQFSLRPARRIYLDLRALVGVTVQRPPDQDLQVSFDGTQLLARVSNNSVAVGFTAGGGMRFTLNPAIALRLGVDYFQSRSRFGYSFDLLRGTEEEIPGIESDLVIRTLELSAGLAYSF